VSFSLSFKLKERFFGVIKLKHNYLVGRLGGFFKNMVSHVKNLLLVCGLMGSPTGLGPAIQIFRHSVT